MMPFEEFALLAKSYSVIPIYETLFSGTETPVTIYEKMAAGERGGFLLESAEQGVWSRYSFIGCANHGMLIGQSGKVGWHSESNDPSDLKVKEKLKGLTGLEAVEALQDRWQAAPVDGLPSLVSGMVGFLGWDTIHEIEKLGPAKPKSYVLPDLTFAVTRDIVIVDHLDSTLKLVSNVFIETAEDLGFLYAEAVARIESMKRRLAEPSQPFLASTPFDTALSFQRNMIDSEFQSMVEKAKSSVVAGDVFQVVVSQRFEIVTAAPALDVYRMLRAINPSPYMYLLNFFDEDGSFAVVGSSPEALVRVQSGQALLHPIAGSRPRGATAEEDRLLAEDLEQDEKERAEHLMLVDLARNDLLKVCKSESVSAPEFMNIERYSHVMHLVSTVQGEIREGTSCVDVVRATFPAGTLSGAPKPRALEIIEELEPDNRGLFGGVVGYFDFSGNADLAIAIRTAVLRNGRGYVQAGAGIVLDSNSDAENSETITKATAPLRAISAANNIQRFKV